MHADATLAPVTPATDPTLAAGPLAPLDHVRHRVAAALFGDPVPARALGRFQLQRLIGAGGMGVVHAATDPELGRTVAVKLLNPAASDARARDRMLREAQAMARLQHPNVVGVLEVGAFADQIYIVMEYVDGGTLGDWLRAAPRSWQAVVQVLAQAGDGLAAAHAAGLVHRDFKPANVLMGGGRPRVSDFGLARSAGDAHDLERTAGDDPVLLGAPLTRTGALLGTPAYMAPEQFHHGIATPQSDQFAFAVVLYESLCGHRPFAGDDLAGIVLNIERARIRPPARRLPAALLAVVRRALAFDPARRYPDMPALLADLRRVRDLRPSRAAAVGLSATAMLAGGLLVLNADPDPRHRDAAARPPGDPGAPGQPPHDPGAAARPPLAFTCDDDPLAGIYDADRRVHLAAALPSGTDPTLDTLDLYASEWRDLQRRHCAARGPGDPAGWTATCLADRRTALADLVHAVYTAGPARRRNAHAAARELLPPLTDCAAPVRHAALTSDAPRDARAAAWQLRLDLAPAFLPRAVTRGVAEPTVPATGLLLRTTDDLRLKHEVGLALLVAAIADKPADERHTAFPELRKLAAHADADALTDLAARTWVLAAEVLESGPHSEADRAHTGSAAAAAVDALPADHPLAARLHRDLGVIELAHARHTLAAGACHRGERDLAACRPIYAAISDLQFVADRPDATASDHELLARAFDHAGETAAAAPHHARGDVGLDESTLGYLAFSTLTAPDAPPLDAGVRCTDDASRCELARADAERWQAEPALLLAAARLMVSRQAGEAGGLKVYGVRAGSPFKRLGCMNGDLLRAVDGRRLASAEDFAAAMTALLARGEGTLEFERKGAVATRRLAVR